MCLLVKVLIVNRGFLFNLAYLDKEELSGSVKGEGLLPQFLLCAEATKGKPTREYCKGGENKRFR